jgi:flagellar hook-length control protein FliK
MKDISLAAGGLLQALSETPVQANGTAGDQATGRLNFTLPEMALDAIGQRVHAAKSPAHDPAAKSGDDDQSAQMQMLLSLFLNQGAAAEPAARMQLSTPNASGKLLQALSLTQGQPAALAQKQSGFFASVSNKTADEVKAQIGNLTAGDAANRLSPKLQAVLASLMASAPAQDSGTPAQQAQLVQSAAQNLRAVAPQAVAQTAPQNLKVDAAPREKESRVAPRIAAADKSAEKPDAQKGNLSAMLLNTTFVKHAATVDNAASVPETTFKLNTQGEEWGEQLTGLLKDRIQFQLNEHQQISTIRLDPPALGKLNISIQLDAGKLVVHIDASQADVSRTLSQLSDNLRQHLTQQNFMQVDVQVSSDGRSQQQSQQGNQGRSQQQQQIVSAAELESEENNGNQNESVLIKV